MSEKEKMSTVVDLPMSILASLFAALMFTAIHNQFPLLTMCKKRMELVTRGEPKGPLRKRLVIGQFSIKCQNKSVVTQGFLYLAL